MLKATIVYVSEWLEVARDVDGVRERFKSGTLASSRA